jgi:hypothetical protein
LGLSAGYLDDIARQLDAHEDQQRAGQERQAREAADDAQRALDRLPLQHDEPAAVAARALAAEASAAAARADLPLSRAQGAEILSVLRDIRDQGRGR